jgi:hypothetical protein
LETRRVYSNRAATKRGSYRAAFAARNCCLQRLFSSARRSSCAQGNPLVATLLRADC